VGVPLESQHIVNPGSDPVTADLKAASLAFFLAPVSEVIAIVDKIPIIAITTKSSIRVKPLELSLFTFFTSLQ